MIVEFEDYKQKLGALEPQLRTLRAAMKLDDAETELAALNAETEQDGFWNDIQRSQKVQQRIKQLQNKIARFKKIEGKYDDLIT